MITPDIIKEYRIAKESVALIDYSYLEKIKVSGSDHIAFLHSILSNDIESLKVGGQCLASLLSANGRILSLMEITRYSDHILLIVEKNQGNSTIQLLDKYIITEDVQLENVTHKQRHLSIVGPEAKQIHDDLPLQHMIPLKSSRAGMEGYDFLFSLDSADEKQQLLIDKGSHLISYKTSELLRIESGVPRYGIDIDNEMFLPETGLEKIAASDTKGCYPGQEVVAKIETYGRLNRKLVKLSIEGDKLPEFGSIITHHHKDVGIIRSSCQLPNKQILAIGLLKKDFFDSKVTFSIILNNTALPCRIIF